MERITQASTVSPYPTRDEHNQQWGQLAREIAQTADHLQETPTPIGSDSKGALIIIGSGLQGLGFTMDAESYLRMADKVFYCVSNPPTQVWLRKLRPDAYDLYVLYDDTKPRYHTYMQMSEAMLYYVRKGMRVVSVFYGHPGVFVLSTHRSIAIARREGYYAIMKPGISALDCLCADLGVDPAQPGMHTFEATDLLLRKRRLDPSVHVVLWQVGLIGEMGYRRKGFINDKFPVLVDYLQETYGEDYEVTHYIAARHATFEPTIAVHKLSEMLAPRVRATFTGISTFYIPPREAAPSDLDMAIRLGFAQPGAKLGKTSPLRQIALYSSRELEAIKAFENFSVPHEYQYQTQTRGAEFLLELAQNMELQDLYRQEPKEAVSEEVFPGLSPRERLLLSNRIEDHAQIAAKGHLVETSPNERLAIDLHRRDTMARAFRAKLVESYRQPDAAEALNLWLAERGYPASLAHFATANERLNASMLLPWTGIYATPDYRLVLIIIGSPEHNNASLVYANLTRIKHFSFNNSTLTWAAEDGNPNHAMLVFKMPDQVGTPGFVRSISGKYWTPDTNKPAVPNLQANEVVPGENPLSVWTSQYETEVTTDGATWSEGPVITVATPRPNQSSDLAPLLLDGQAIQPVHYDDTTLTWGTNRLTFAHDPQARDGKVLSGQLEGYWTGGINLKGSSLPHYDRPFQGSYLTCVFCDGQWMSSDALSYDENGIRIGQQTVEGAVFNRNLLHWTDAGGDLNHGRIQFFIDPITQLPKFVGYVWATGRRPVHPTIMGAYAISTPHHVSPDIGEAHATLRAGRYTTSIRLDDGTFGPDGPILELIDAGMGALEVRLSDGTATLQVDHPIFNPQESTLSWQHPQASGALSQFANAVLRFDAAPLTSAMIFHGTYWPVEEQAEAEAENWAGHSVGVQPRVPVGGTQIPVRVWEILGTLGLEGRNPSVHLLWSRWQRARFTCRLANGLVRKFCDLLQQSA